MTKLGIIDKHVMLPLLNFCNLRLTVPVSQGPVKSGPGTDSFSPSDGSDGKGGKKQNDVSNKSNQ